MSAVFLKLLNMSIAAGWMVVAVIVFRLCLRKAPKAIHCALWALVAIRLLCPFSLESSYSLIPEGVANGNIVSEWTDDYVGDVSTIYDDSAHYDAAVAAGREPIYAGEGHYYVVTAEDQLGAPATIENTVIPVLSWIWLVGGLALLFYAVISYLRICFRVKVSLHLKDNLWQNEQVDSPFILGVFRPRIYLPFGIEEGQMNYVIAHEQAHLRRCDHYWKPVGFILLAVYWFNPLMWVAYILLCRDIELACDEKVIRDMGTQDKKAYSEALLACSVPRRMIAACPLAFGEVGAKKRIASVLHYKKPAFWILLVALVASVIVAMCFMTNPFSARIVPEKLAENTCVEVHIQSVSIADFDEPTNLLITDKEIIDQLVDSIGSTTFKKTFRRFHDSPGNLAAVVQLLGEVENPNKNPTIFSLTMLTSPNIQDGEYAIYTTVTDADGQQHHLVAHKPDVLIDHIVSLIEDGESNEVTSSAQEMWARKMIANPVEMLAYLCHSDLWNDRIEEKPKISVPGNFGPHAQFFDTPDDADALDAAMAKRAFLLMRLYPEEVFYVTWSYPDADGNEVCREFFADEMSAILGLSSNMRDYEIPASVVDVERLIRFLTIDEKLFLRHATEGNDYSPLLAAQENAVWFTPEDIHDVEYMELVWHDGQRFTPLTGEGYDYVQTRLGSAKEIGATGCPYHSVLYIHRSDGMVGKVLPAEDSCDVFQSDGKYYQFGDRENPPYSDGSERFYSHFGTSVNDLPHYTTEIDNPIEAEDANDDAMRRLGEVVLNGTTFYDRNLAPSTVIFSNPDTLSKIERAFSSHQWEFIDAPQSEPRWTNLIELPPFVFYDHGGLVRCNPSTDVSILWNKSALKDTIWYRAPGMFEAMQEVTGTFFHEKPAQPPEQPAREPLGGTPLQLLKHDRTFEDAHAYLKQLMEDWQSVGVGTLSNAKVGVHNYFKADTYQSYLIKDDAIYVLPLPYVNGALDCAQPANSHLDMNQWTYSYEAVVPETVRLPDSTVYHAGEYTYLVDLLDLTYQFSFVPAENAFGIAGMEFSDQTLHTSADTMTYEERLAWAQVKPYYEEEYTPMGRYAKGEGCIACLCTYLGGERRGMEVFEFRFADGMVANLPLPPNGFQGGSISMRFEAGKFIYEKVFSTEERTDDGQGLIYLEGTYRYEVDLTAKTVSLAVIQ